MLRLPSLDALRRSRYRREAVVSSVGSLLIYACGFATGPVLARVLGPEGRGEIAAVLVPVGVLGWLLPFGLPLAAAYWVGEEPEGRLISTVTLAGLVLGTPICVALWFLAPPYFADFSPTALRWARLMLVFIPFSTGVLAALEMQRRRGAGIAWNFFRTSSIVVPSVLVVLLAAVGELTVQTTLATYFFGGILPFLFFLSRVRSAPLMRPSLASLRRLTPYAWRTTGLGMASAATARLDQLVLATLASPGQLGLYAVAVTASSLTNPLSSGLSLALFGHLRDEVEAGRAGSRFRRSLKATLVLSTGAALLIGVPAPQLLRTILGSPFQEAAAALRLLLPGAVAFNILDLLTSKLYADGQPGEATRAGVVALVVTVVGVAAVVPHFGIEGAAAVTSAAYSCAVLLVIARGALRTAPRVPTVVAVAQPSSASARSGGDVVDKATGPPGSP